MRPRATLCYWRAVGDACTRVRPLVTSDWALETCSWTAADDDYSDALGGRQS